MLPKKPILVSIFGLNQVGNRLTRKAIVSCSDCFNIFVRSLSAEIIFLISAFDRLLVCSMHSVLVLRRFLVSQN